ARMLVPTNFADDRWISSIEIRPDMHDTIHHALIWILSPGSVVPPVDQLPVDLQLLGAYSPGDGEYAYPAGIARHLPRGSILLVDLYARPMGGDMRSRLRIALRFADDAASYALRTLVMAASALDIPPDRADVDEKIEARLSGRARLFALTPYMRARGRRVTIDIAAPDQPTERLLDAPRYDYRWQIC